MKPEAQRIAIAEACGWQCVHNETFSDGSGGFTWDARGMPPKQNLRRPIPDYPSDLNAMHEAEKVLTKTQRNTYVNLLDGLIGDDEQPDKDFAWCCATAAQRAEAFLRTLGKWEDS